MTIKFSTNAQIISLTLKEQRANTVVSEEFKLQQENELSMASNSKEAQKGNSEGVSNKDSF